MNGLDSKVEVHYQFSPFILNIYSLAFFIQPFYLLYLGQS